VIAAPGLSKTNASALGEAPLLSSQIEASAQSLAADLIDLVARSHSATTSTSPVPSASIAFSSCGRPLIALPDAFSCVLPAFTRVGDKRLGEDDVEHNWTCSCYGYARRVRKLGGRLVH
jgi:hypothetical protein